MAAIDSYHQAMTNDRMNQHGFEGISGASKAPFTRRTLLGGVCGMCVGLLTSSCQLDRDGSDVVSTTRAGSDEDVQDSSTGKESIPEPVIGPTGHYDEVQVFGDGTKHLIPIEDIVEGGPAKDGIPSIDAPTFAGSERWKALNYREDEWVIGVEVDGQRRAYPFQVLVWHEIVNELFHDLPLLVTFCPLCGSGIVFRRVVNGHEGVEFGVTGRLYNSDLLMYDRLTNSVWSQITGTAVIGERTGDQLEIYPSELLTWGDWKQAYPDSEVLSRDTGFKRDYDQRPYGPYDETITIPFPVAGRDDRLHPKTRITGIQLDSEKFVAYPDNVIQDHKLVNDEVDGTPLLVVADHRAGGNVLVFSREVNGQVLRFRAEGEKIVDHATDTVWNLDGVGEVGPLAGSHLPAIATTKAFWFAWFAFHQDTELWVAD